MTSFESWILPYIGVATPSLQVSVIQKGNIIYRNHFGENYKYYDLASLTKIIFTVQATMFAVEKYNLNIEDKVQKYLPDFANSQVSVFDLLTHSSGLIWWQPFYEKLKNQPQGLSRHQLLKSEIIELSKNLQNYGLKSVYSDVGFLTLGLLLESVFQKTWTEIFDLLKVNGLIFGETHFNSLDQSAKFSAAMYAPTSLADWRGEDLRAQVNDENCWSLGGVAPHAGLFGSLRDVEAFALGMRANYLGNSGVLSSQLLRKFLSRAVPESVGDWSLGWMMPTTGGSSAGQFFSPMSVGHTGFTGTSFWWDLDKDFAIILLANRTLLGKEKKDFTKLRPLIHDQLVQTFNLKG